MNETNRSPNPPRRKLPPLVGLASFEEASKPGIAVNDCVDRLKRYHYVLRRLFQIFNARLTSEPVYELKMAFSYHAYLCSQHIGAIRDRVAEMRHPPLGLDKVPDPHLKMFFDEILNTPSTIELLAGVYQKALPALRDGLARHLAETNPLADQPSVRILKIAAMEVDEMADWGAEAMEEEFHEDRQVLGAELDQWLELLDACLAAAGGLDGTGKNSGRAGEQEAADKNLTFSPILTLTPKYSSQPFDYERLKTPVRDERFPDPYNMGVHAEAFLFNPAYPADAKTLMMYFKRLREIDVPEMMASIIIETPDKPWAFHRDLARQLWDEARHAMMGEVGFLANGIDWPAFVRVNFTWSKGLNEQLSPAERHAVLWFIEQGLMDKNTGKPFEWKVGVEAGDPLSALFQDYDWADEVLHARIGREHYVDQVGSITEASKQGSEAWSKVTTDWQQWKRDGLTEHKNWWPALYREYCRIKGIEPDPAALAFNESYAETRADLQRVAASG